MITLQNITHNWGNHAGLWFVIPDALQAAVVPWLKASMSKVPEVEHRKHYRKQLTKAAMAEKYSEKIWGKSDIGHSHFYIYASFGVWRVGCGEGMKAKHIEDVKADILASIQSYADLQKVVDPLPV